VGRRVGLARAGGHDEQARERAGGLRLDQVGVEAIPGILLVDVWLAAVDRVRSRPTSMTTPSASPKGDGPGDTGL
jgi:hypothetical protein